MALNVVPTPNGPADVCFHSITSSSHFGPLETSVMNCQTSSTGRSITTLASVFVMRRNQAGLDDIQVVYGCQRFWWGWTGKDSIRSFATAGLLSLNLVPPCFAIYSYEYTFQQHSDDASVSYLSTGANVVVNYTDRFSGSWRSCGRQRGPARATSSRTSSPDPVQSASSTLGGTRQSCTSRS